MRRFGLRLFRPWLIAAVTGALAVCRGPDVRRGDTVLFASGADLQSINPLFTVHPLARQVQRYVLLTTLVRYDSAMGVEPYLARRWTWSGDGRRLTLFLTPAVRWHDGTPTTAHDAAWTLRMAQQPPIGYPRARDLAGVRVQAPDDTTLLMDFATPPGRIPDVLTDLAILPRHLLGDVPARELRQAGWHRAPVGNGPFRFVAHEPNRRWVFERNDEFPAELGGPPRLRRLVIAVVDEPMTKLAALTAGELDFAGIQPAHARFVARQPALRAVDYPLLFSIAMVYNTRHPPFDDLAARAAVASALDRQALVDGVLYGFATPATAPIPPELGAAAEAPRRPGAEATPPGPLAFELLTVGSGEAALEQMVQAQLARRGIAVRIRQLELSAFLARVYGAHPEFDAAILGTPGDPGLGYLAPLVELSGLAVPRGTEAVLRFIGDSLPVTFVYHARGLQGMNRRVAGVELGLRGELATVSRWHILP